MSFAGNLKTVSLVDVFQLIFASQKTGALSVTKNQSRREIYFKMGMLVYASSTDEDDLFGNLLLKKGKISKLELERVLRDKPENKKIGAVLVERNIFSREEVISCLRSQIEEIVYGIFGWKDGNFEFIENKTPPAETIQTELNPMNIIMEGTRRIDEWEELKKVLPPDDAAVELVRDPIMRSEEMKLSKNEFIVLALIGSGKKVSQVIHESFLDQFLTCKALTNLMQLGLVKVGKAVVRDKTSEQEEIALVEILALVYINNLRFIFESLKEKLGSKGEKVIFETFQENKIFYPTLSQVFAGKDGQINFELFIELYKRLPAGARIWKIISNFNGLLNDYLNAVQKNLGNKLYKRVISEIKINIQNDINKNRQIALKYGLEEEFSRILKDRE